MRILQLCNKAPYPSNDGSSIAIFTLAEGLADNGIDLHLIPINTKKHFKPDSQIPDSFKQKTHYSSVYKNTDTGLLGALFNLFSTHSYFVSRFLFTKYELKLIEKLQTTEFDIIQLEGVFMAVYIPIIKKYSKAKIILRSHNVEHQIWERHLVNEKNAIKKWYLTLQNNRLKKFEIASFKLVDAVVTITQEDEKIISVLSPKTPCYTCLTGVNLQKYQHVLTPKNTNTVFHFASMDWMPNVEAVDWLLNTVWTEVIKKTPNAQLVLAGKGMPERFKKLESSNIKIIDFVEDSEVFYNNFDIMLVPLWSGSGLRIKLVEGLAYGKAIITTSIGAEGIPYKVNEDILIADSSTEFSEAIITLLSQPEKKQQLQISARALAVANFDYKLIAKQLISFYKTL
jgi:glycosyltransferase involved in cell wall biosynthesis